MEFYQAFGATSAGKKDLGSLDRNQGKVNNRFTGLFKKLYFQLPELQIAILLCCVHKK